MNISIKNPPERLVERLKQRAASHNRTPEDEVLVILEAALESTPPSAGPAAVLEELRNLGLRTKSDAVQIIREFRDR